MSFNSCPVRFSIKIFTLQALKRLQKVMTINIAGFIQFPKCFETEIACFPTELNGVLKET